MSILYAKQIFETRFSFKPTKFSFSKEESVFLDHALGLRVRNEEVQGFFSKTACQKGISLLRPLILR
jgi:hypothetical protein